LAHFEGTVVVVSHDREFLTGLTTKTFEFTPEGIREHLGDVNEFLEKKKVAQFREIEKGKSTPAPAVKAPVPVATDQGSDKNLKKLKQQLDRVEKDIAETEAVIAQKEADLQDPIKAATLSTDAHFLQDYEMHRKKLAELMEKWEKLVAEMEA
jgi:ATP-binding cassette subfamily F protein 3